MVGKAVKCPGCAQTLKVPGGGGGGVTPRKAAAPADDAAFSDGSLDDLFDEEGFEQSVESVCPSCRSVMPAGAVLCVKCGFHRESGTRLTAHQIAGVDIDQGTLALQKAQMDMIKDQEMQQKMLSGAGMPWWALALILFIIGSALTIGVLTVNASRRVDETVSFNPLGLFLLLAGIAFGMVALGSLWMILVHGVKQEGKKGFLILVPPYVLYYVYQNFRATWKFFFVALVTGSACGGLIAAATAQGI